MKKYVIILSLLALFNGSCFASELFSVSKVQYRYWGFSLYYASFFTACDKKDLLEDDYWDEDCVYKLRLDYLRSFTSEDLIESSEKMMKRILDSKYADIAKDFDQFQEYFKNVKEGDSYTLTFSREKGISLYLNDAFQGNTKNSNFAKAYFNIWLSEKGISKENAYLLRGK